MIQQQLAKGRNIYLACCFAKIIHFLSEFCLIAAKIALITEKVNFLVFSVLNNFIHTKPNNNPRRNLWMLKLSSEVAHWLDVEQEKVTNFNLHGEHMSEQQ